MGESLRDSDLVRKALEGDIEAFEVPHGRYRPAAVLTAERLVGDHSESEDVVQEAMVRVYTRLGQLADPDRFGAWLAAVVRRAALDHLRRRQSGVDRFCSFDETVALPDARNTLRRKAMKTLDRQAARSIVEDHHETIYGPDLIAELYRPDPKGFALQAASRALQIVRAGKTPHPAGFQAIAHWQALKLIRPRFPGASKSHFRRAVG